MRTWTEVLRAVFFAALAATLAPTLSLAQARTQTFYLVGDILYYGDTKDAEEVGRFMAALLADNPQARGILLGDVCNKNGLRECYEELQKTSWGPILPLLYSVPGNHDYEQVGCTEQTPIFYNYLFNYGNRGEGWQVFNAAEGSWAVMLLNTEVMCRVNGKILSIGRRQLEWMERELQLRHKTQCILTAYHQPMYASSANKSPSMVRSLWYKSVKFGVDFYAVAHHHGFVDMPPLFPINDETARVDQQGIDGVFVGTGGAIAHPIPRISLWDEVAISGIPGVLKLTLYPGGYYWEFLPVPSRQAKVPRLQGEGLCHNNPPGYIEPKLD